MNPLDKEITDGLRRRVLKWFSAQKDGGTDDECQAAMGMRHQTETPRRWELSGGGCLKDSGKRRPTRSGYPATVWVATGVEYDAVDWAAVNKAIRPVALLRAEVARLRDALTAIERQAQLRSSRRIIENMARAALNQGTT